MQNNEYLLEQIRFDTAENGCGVQCHPDVLQISYATEKHLDKLLHTDLEMIAPSKTSILPSSRLGSPPQSQSPRLPGPPRPEGPVSGHSDLSICNGRSAEQSNQWALSTGP